MNPLDTCNPFMTAYCKGAEARVITSDHLARMLKASGVKDMVVIVRDTDLGRHLEEHVPAGFGEADDCLWRYLGGCFGALERLTRFPREMRGILDAWLLKYDLANVKAALHGIAAGRKARMIPIGAIHARGALEALSAAQDVDTVAGIANECQLAGFAAPLAAWRDAQDAGGRLQAEAALTKEYYRALLKVARSFGGNGPLAMAIGLLIDCANLQMALRAVIGGLGPAAADAAIEGGFSISRETTRELLGMKIAEVPARLENTPHGVAAREIAGAWAKSASAAAVEDVLARHRFTLVREALAMRLLSPVLVAWYVVLKEAEARNVRLLLKARFDDLPEDRVRESLVPIW
jgi:vacuolar-type H+-ATPase subunit C/Vma6